jgi:hypothetical protein
MVNKTVKEKIFMKRRTLGIILMQFVVALVVFGFAAFAESGVEPDGTEGFSVPITAATPAPEVAASEAVAISPPPLAPEGPETVQLEGVIDVDTYLNIRTGPWGKIIGSLRTSDKVKIISKEGDWFKILNGGEVAFVHSYYVDAPGYPSHQGIEPPILDSDEAPGSTTGGTAVGGGAAGGSALLGYLQQAGLTGEELRMAWAIGMAESGGDPNAFNGDSSTGDKSYGLFQINMIDDLGPARLAQYGLNANEDLFDPAVNIRVMIAMSGNCSDWSPWSTYNRGDYEEFLSQYPPQ